MNFDLLGEWMALHPLDLFLLVSSLLLLGPLAGWYVRGRRARRAAGAGQSRMSKAPEATPKRWDEVSVSDALAQRHADEMSLHEWDGGQPRPNFNRQIRLGSR
jgi:hypothetical protein